MIGQYENSEESSLQGMLHYGNQENISVATPPNKERQRLNNLKALLLQLEEGSIVSRPQLELPHYSYEVAWLFDTLQNHTYLVELTLSNVSNCHLEALGRFIIHSKKLRAIHLTFNDECLDATRDAIYSLLLNNHRFSTFILVHQGNTYTQQRNTQEQRLIRHFGWQPNYNNARVKLSERAQKRVKNGFASPVISELNKRRKFYSDFSAAIRLGAQTAWFDEAWKKATKYMPHLTTDNLKQRLQRQHAYMQLAVQFGNLEAVQWLFENVYENDPAIFLTHYDRNQKNIFTLALAQKHLPILTYLYAQLSQDLPRIVTSLPDRYRVLLLGWVTTLSSQALFTFCLLDPFHESLNQTVTKVFESFVPPLNEDKLIELLNLLTQSTALTKEQLVFSIVPTNNFSLLQRAYNFLINWTVDFKRTWPNNHVTVDALWQAIEKHRAYNILHEIIDPDHQYDQQQPIIYQFILSQLKRRQPQLVSPLLSFCHMHYSISAQRGLLLRFAASYADQTVLKNILNDFFYNSPTYVMGDAANQKMILHAAATGHLDFFNYVFAKFCESSLHTLFSIKDTDNKGALFYALSSNSYLLIKRIFDLYESYSSQACFTQTDRENNSLLLYYLKTQEQPHLEILNYLLIHTQDLMQANVQGENILTCALQKSHFTEALICLCVAGALCALREDSLTETEFRHLMEHLARNNDTFCARAEDGSNFCHTLVSFDSPQFLQIFFSFFPAQKTLLFEKNQQQVSAFSMEQCQSQTMRAYLKRFFATHYNEPWFVEPLYREIQLELSYLVHVIGIPLAIQCIRTLLEIWHNSERQLQFEVINLSNNLLPDSLLISFIETAAKKMPHLKLLDISYTASRVIFELTQPIMAALVTLIEADTPLEILRFEGISITAEQASQLNNGLAKRVHPLSVAFPNQPLQQPEYLNKRADLLSFNALRSRQLKHVALPTTCFVPGSTDTEDSLSEQFIYNFDAFKQHVAQATYTDLVTDEGFKQLLTHSGFERRFHLAVYDRQALVDFFTQIRTHLFQEAGAEHCLILEEKWPFAVVVAITFRQTTQFEVSHWYCLSAQRLSETDQAELKHMLETAVAQAHVAAEVDLQFSAVPQYHQIQPKFFGALKIISDTLSSTNDVLAALQHCPPTNFAVQNCLLKHFLFRMSLHAEDVARYTSLQIATDTERRFLPDLAERFWLQLYPIGHNLIDNPPSTAIEAYNRYQYLIHNEILPLFELPDTELQALIKMSKKKQLSPLACYQVRAKEFKDHLQSLPISVNTDTNAETVQTHFQALADGFFKFCAYGITGHAYTQQTRLNQLMFACIDTYRLLYQDRTLAHHNQIPETFSHTQRHFYRQFLTHLNSVYMVSVVTHTGLVKRDNALTKAQNNVVHVTKAAAAIAISTSALLHVFGVFIIPVHHVAEKAIPRLVHAAGHFLEAVGEAAYVTKHLLETVIELTHSNLDKLSQTIAGVCQRIDEEQNIIPHGRRVAQQIRNRPHERMDNPSTQANLIQRPPATLGQALSFNTSKYLQKIFSSIPEFNLFSDLSQEISLQLSDCYRNQLSQLDEKGRKNFATALAMHIIDLFGSGVLYSNGTNEKEYSTAELVEIALLWVQHVPMAKHGHMTMQTPYGRFKIDQLARGCGIVAKTANNESVYFFNAYQATAINNPLKIYLQKREENPLLTYPDLLPHNEIAIRQMSPLDYELIKTAHNHATSEQGSPSVCQLEDSHPFAHLVNLQVRIQEYAGINQVVKPEIKLQSPSVKVREHENRLQIVESSLEQYRRRLEELERDVGRASDQGARGTLQGRVRKLISDFNTLQTNLEDKDSEIKELERKIDELTSDNNLFADNCIKIFDSLKEYLDDASSSTASQPNLRATNLKRLIERTIFAYRNRGAGTNTVNTPTQSNARPDL